jgi:hypothetical protein
LPSGNLRTSGLKLPEAFSHGHADGKRFPKQTPRFKTAARHRTNVWKLFFLVFWPVSAPESLHETNDFSPEFKLALHQRAVNKLGHERVRGDE